jgi:hypothetical protein
MQLSRKPRSAALRNSSMREALRPATPDGALQKGDENTTTHEACRYCNRPLPRGFKHPVEQKLLKEAPTGDAEPIAVQ